MAHLKFSWWLFAFRFFGGGFQGFANKPTVCNGGVNRGRICDCWCSWQVTVDRWQVTRNTWHVKRDTWHFFLLQSAKKWYIAENHTLVTKSEKKVTEKRLKGPKVLKRLKTEKKKKTMLLTKIYAIYMCFFFFFSIFLQRKTFPCKYIFNRPGVAGVVLWTPSQLINWLTDYVILLFRIFPNRKI